MSKGCGGDGAPGSVSVGEFCVVSGGIGCLTELGDLIIILQVFLFSQR